MDNKEIRGYTPLYVYEIDSNGEFRLILNKNILKY